MAFVRRQVTALLSPRRVATARSLLALIAFVGLASMRVSGQVSDGVGTLSQASVFLTPGIENTQFPYYADNALGFDSGVSYQPKDLLGFEARIGAYPYSARFLQVPITAGYRVAASTLFGLPYAPFAYVGGGVSRSQAEGLGKISTSPVFAACWQLDVGLDRTFSAFSWRVVQISRRETYGPQQSLRTLGLSTGIVYRLGR
jgi:hypothetical protein